MLIFTPFATMECGNMWYSLWQSVAVCGSLWQSVALLDYYLTITAAIYKNICGAIYISDYSPISLVVFSLVDCFFLECIGVSVGAWRPLLLLLRSPPPVASWTSSPAWRAGLLPVLCRAPPGAPSCPNTSCIPPFPAARATSRAPSCAPSCAARCCATWTRAALYSLPWCCWCFWCHKSSTNNCSSTFPDLVL